ncbi:MAG: YARHG domain-containing protein [Lachnospiraceae bacterium]|nr:YARHG domain-containing protein [Lachnospiraceae bacterium]
MEKENMKFKVPIIILAVVIALILAFCISMPLFLFKKPALSPKQAKATVTYPEPDEAAYNDGQYYSMMFDGLTITDSGVSGTSIDGINEAVSSDDYICSYSSDRILNEEDIAKAWESHPEEMPAGRSIPQMIINEMYARHGYIFSTADIQEYFNQKSWYNAIGTYNPDMDDVYKQMSDIEHANIEYLKTFD